MVSIVVCGGQLGLTARHEVAAIEVERAAFVDGRFDGKPVVIRT
jgi:hypothetical protein